MRVYHITEAKHALSDIEQRSVKVARLAELNDPFELLAANLVNRAQRDAFERNKSDRNRKIGLICFSGMWSNPVLWGHYGDAHRGICLGFDVAEKLLARVIYADKPEKIPLLGKNPSLTVALLPFFNRLIRTKFMDWKYEDEWRVFVKLDKLTEQDGLYFYNFSKELVLREVILGPRCAVSAERVQKLVSAYPYPVYVLKSRLAFSKFKVIRDRRPARTQDV